MVYTSIQIPIIDTVVSGIRETKLWGAMAVLINYQIIYGISR